MITTTSILPPPIHQTFSKDLLMSLIEVIKNKVYEKIIPVSEKKIREQDIGKKREFERLMREFKELYERKKDEEKRYNEKIKNATEMPRIPTTKVTVKFKRYQS